MDHFKEGYGGLGECSDGVVTTNYVWSGENGFSEGGVVAARHVRRGDAGD